MTTIDCCSSKIKIEFVVQDSETEELIDLKSTFDVSRNGFSEAMQNIKDKIALANCILKKKIEVAVYRKWNESFRNFFNWQLE